MTVGTTECENKGKIIMDATSKELLKIASWGWDTAQWNYAQLACARPWV